MPERINAMRHLDPLKRLKRHRQIVRQQGPHRVHRLSAHHVLRREPEHPPAERLGYVLALQVALEPTLDAVHGAVDLDGELLADPGEVEPVQAAVRLGESVLAHGGLHAEGPQVKCQGLLARAERGRGAWAPHRTDSGGGGRGSQWVTSYRSVLSCSQVLQHPEVPVFGGIPMYQA